MEKFEYVLMHNRGNAPCYGPALLVNGPKSPNDPMLDSDFQLLDGSPCVPHSYIECGSCGERLGRPVAEDIIKK